MQRTNKVIAERVTRYIEDKIRARVSTVKYPMVYYHVIPCQENTVANTITETHRKVGCNTRDANLKQDPGDRHCYIFDPKKVVQSRDLKNSSNIKKRNPKNTKIGQNMSEKCIVYTFICFVRAIW